jgi:hypothetical protein
MSKILLVLATLATTQPAGQTFGGKYLFNVDGAAAIEPAPQHTTDDLADGIHVATCQALDTANAPMGAQVSLSFTLAAGQIVVPGAPAPAPAPAPDATYPAPVSLTASVVTA